MENKKIYFMTLGCPKNTVDSENMMFELEEAGYETVELAQEADIIVINTCSFILDAKEESVDAILSAVEMKQQKPELKIVVSGCLAQRYAAELEKEIPEVDLFLGTGDMFDIAQLIDSENKVHTQNMNRLVSETGRILTTSAYAYIKLSEGCDKNCTYCIIPKLRGRQRSREFEDILNEARELCEGGVSELILIAQDTGEYGTDLYGKRRLPELLSELDKIGFTWIRLLYVYPETVSPELISAMAAGKSILHYIDIPLQHINDEILRAMGRKTDRKSIIKLILDLRAAMPDIVIRSSFITGFPGESAEQVSELRDFLIESELTRVGVFTYSAEEGTPAAKMKNQIAQDEKKRRCESLMATQEKVSERILERYLDKSLSVLIEEDLGEGAYIGRSFLDAPDIDGVVYVYTDKALETGKYYDVLINDTMSYDLIGSC